jgi:Flp pilus assembly protein TadG
MTPMLRLLSARENRCVAALEFALLAPVFVMVFAGVVDLGNALYTWSKVEAALAVGANYALTHTGQVNSTNGAALASSIATVVSGTNAGTAANADSCYCPTGTPGSWTWGTAVTCANACPNSTTTAGRFVTITASYSFTAFFAGYGFVTNGAITGGAAVQTQ